MGSQKKEEVYGALTFYRELAYFINRREEYERAIPYFDEAIEKAQTDKRTLMGRSWARSKICQYEGALEDIAKALNQDPEDLVAIALKALNTYLCCEFEDALVLNLRMVPKRKKPDNFTMGVMHCNEAIENCIGLRAGRPLRDHFKIIRRLAWKKARDAEKPYEPKTKHKKKKKRKPSTKKVIREVIPTTRSKASKSVKSVKSGMSRTTQQSQHSQPGSNVSIKKTGEEEMKTGNVDTKSPFPSVSDVGEFFGKEAADLFIYDSLHTLKTESDYVPPGKPFPYRPLQRYTTNIENYMAEKYLDSMYLDKIFLKNLKKHLGVKSPNKEGAQKVVHMGKEGFRTLSYKQELLRTRKPFYFIKYQEARLSGALRGRIEAELRKMQNFAKADADTLLNKIKIAINEKQTRVALENAEKLKLFCDLKPKKVLPTREDYLNQMYKLVCQAYYQLFRLNRNQYEWDQVKRIYNWFGMARSREPSTDSVINQFKDSFTDWKKQVVLYEDRLRKATSPEEMAWSYHELARSHAELKQYELARVYARKCMKEGRATSNHSWVINAVMMLAKINMQQHNRNDTKTELNAALMVARQIPDEIVEEYITKCLEVVETIDFDDSFGAKVLEKRERQIIRMMAGAGMKDEVTFLFRKMGAMPSTRRLSVMPGVRLDETGEKITASSRKMSIMPSKGTEEAGGSPPPHAKAESGKKVDKRESESKKGIAFMELIKYHVD